MSTPQSSEVERPGAPAGGVALRLAAALLALAAGVTAVVLAILLVHGALG
jgi:hypothetical protein